MSEQIRKEFLKPESRVHKFISKDQSLRVSAVIATDVIEDLRKIQNLMPIPAVAVGRASIAALLMSSQLKNMQRLSVYFRGSGPLSSVFAESSFEGKMRAFTSNPDFEVPIQSDNIQVGAAIGIGLLTVTHHLPNQEQPHRGTVVIKTGEIGDDIAFYLEQSHQIPSVVSLGVHLDRFGRVEAAGGILIELMPGHTEETIEKLELGLKNVPSLSKRILEGASVQEIVKDYTSSFELMELEHPYRVQYECRCSQERMRRSLMLLGLQEIDEMIAENKSFDVLCEFCGRKYEVQTEELKEIRQDVYKQSLN